MLAPATLSETHALHMEEVRKIPVDLAARFGVTSSGPHLAFEFRRNGTCVYRQVKRERRNEEGQREKAFHIEPKGSALFWWNDDCLNEVSPSAILIITEGVEDALSWIAAGASHVVSVPNGTPDRPGEGDVVPSEDTRFPYLWVDGALDPRLKQFKIIVLAVDDDKAGRILRDELALRLGRDRCYVVAYPDGLKDSNAVLQKFGTDEGGSMLMDALADARPMVPSKLVKFSDIPEAQRVPLTTGWRHADPFIKLVVPELAVVTGPPGAGKSQWALALGANLAHWHGLPGAILQFEDDVERNRADLIRYAMAEKDIADGDRAKALDWIDRMVRTMSPAETEDDDRDLAWLKRTITEAAQRHGAKWVLIDPWNEVEHLWGKGQTETQYLNDALRTLKRLARRLQIILVVVTHPDKQGGQKEIDDLSLYDINGGAVWNNKADHGVIIWRENPTANETHVKIAKTKNHALMGRPGTFRMRYRPSAATFDFIL